MPYFLLLYLSLDHFELCRGRLLIGHELLSVRQPAEQRLQRILESPTMQEGFMQLGRALSNLSKIQNREVNKEVTCLKSI